MPISAAHEGRQYPPTAPHKVSAAKIEEFSRALGDDRPAYHARPPCAPPTFVAVIAARAWDALFADPELALSLDRTVHAEQRFSFVRPLVEGDEAIARLRIERVRSVGDADLISVAVDVEAGGEVVATSYSTLMHARGSDA